MKRIALAVILLMLTKMAFCQENFLNGYIVTLTGDTIHGLINYGNWERNPSSIIFKESIDSKRQEYTPIEIKGFFINNENYESAIIKTEISPTKTSELSHDPKLVFETDTTFLRALLRGPKSLYFYSNKNGKDQFYIKTDSSYKLLTYKRYIRTYKDDAPLEMRNSDVVAENKTYLGELTVYLNDCPTIQSKLKSTIYATESLKKLFQYYYSCTDSKIEFQQKTDKAKFTFGIIAGVSMSSLVVKSSENSYNFLKKLNNNQSTNITGGFFMEIKPARNPWRWSFYNELLYYSFKVEGAERVDIAANQYTITNTEIGLSFLKLNTMVRFKHPLAKMMLFFNAGVSNSLLMNEKNYSKVETVFYSADNTVEKQAFKSANYCFGYGLGIGAIYTRYSFEVRYMAGENFSGSSGALTVSSNQYFILLGYKF